MPPIVDPVQKETGDNSFNTTNPDSQDLTLDLSLELTPPEDEQVDNVCVTGLKTTKGNPMISNGGFNYSFKSNLADGK